MLFLEYHIKKLELMVSISIFQFLNYWRILSFKTKSSCFQAMDNTVLICARMNLRETLQTLQFTAHNKLCLDKIFFPMRYKVHARQPF